MGGEKNEDFDLENDIEEEDDTEEDDILLDGSPIMPGEEDYWDCCRRGRCDPRH
jgi:hypothetical protein